MKFCSRSTPLFVLISLTLMRYWDRQRVTWHAERHAAAQHVMNELLAVIRREQRWKWGERDRKEEKGGTARRKWSRERWFWAGGRKRFGKELGDDGGGGTVGWAADLTHAQLEGAPLLLQLLGDLPSADLSPYHPILTSQLPLLLLHLLAANTHTQAHNHPE